MIQEKRCSRCKAIKAISLFHKSSSNNDGRNSQCAACRNAYYKTDAGRAVNEAYRTTEAARISHRLANAKHNKTENARLAKIAYAKSDIGRAANKAYKLMYRKTEAYIASRTRNVEASRTRYPIRVEARTAVSSAIRSGILVRWPACAVPECDRKPEAHHPDYSRPLDVVWLCFTHHRQAHALVRERCSPTN